MAHRPRQASGEDRQQRAPQKVPAEHSPDHRGRSHAVLSHGVDPRGSGDLPPTLTAERPLARDPITGMGRGQGAWYRQGKGQGLLRPAL